MSFVRSLCVAALAGAVCAYLFGGHGLTPPMEGAIAATIGYVAVYIADKGVSIWQ